MLCYVSCFVFLLSLCFVLFCFVLFLFITVFSIHAELIDFPFYLLSSQNGNFFPLVYFQLQNWCFNGL